MNQGSNLSGRSIVLGPGLVPIPERLLLAHARGEVLFIAGAGISRSAGLPDFRELVVKVYKELDLSTHAVISKMPISGGGIDGLDLSNLQDWQKAEVARFRKGEYDVVLGMLERRLEGQEEPQSQVRGTIRRVLRPSKSRPAPIHRSLMRLSDRGAGVAVITTNFDLLLETAASRMRSSVQTYALGAIPRPRPPSNPEFHGVFHVHGALDRNPNRTSELILSDRDFGEFYLRRRIVPDLIYDATRLYNLVLVGYSANDPPMRYLLDAVAADVVRFPEIKERFIFVGMSDEDAVGLEDWRARGITPIPYKVPDSDHSLLHRTLARWAEFSAITGDRNQIDRDLKRTVRVRRSDASERERDLFDHLIRRSDTNERIRLSRLASESKADLGWLDAIVAVASEEGRKLQ